MIAIGRMEKGDVGEVEALAAEAGLRTYDREWFEQEIGSDGALFLVARDTSPDTPRDTARDTTCDTARDMAGPRDEAQGRIVGALLCRLIVDDLEIDDLVVAPYARRRGIARSLITHSAKLSFERGVKRAVLEVREGNWAARRLYEGLGFRLAGVRRGYYRAPDEDALVMVCEGGEWERLIA